MLNANLSYQILSWLNVAGRIRIDNSNTDSEEKLYATSNKTLTEGSDYGYYGVSATKDKQTYGDLMLNINKTFKEIISLQANIGGSFSNIQQDVLTNQGPIREDLFSNKFNVFQLDNTKTRRIQSGYHDQTKSLFASLELGYKGAYYLTLTGRNDWPSQLAGPNSKKTSFFLSINRYLSSFITDIPITGANFLLKSQSIIRIGRFTFSSFLGQSYLRMG